MSLLIFVATETGVCVLLPTILTSTSAAIPAFRPCLSSRCLAMDYSTRITICFDSQLKHLFPFRIVFYSTFVIMYPNDQSSMPNDSVNIGKHIKAYLPNTCIFNMNPGNQCSPMTFLFTLLLKTKIRNNRIRKWIFKWLTGIVLTLIEFEAREITKISRKFVGHEILICYHHWECSNHLSPRMPMLW
jgi:hypothetical protein